MTPATSKKPCRKCGGTGYLPHLARVDAGRCWRCLPAAAPVSAEVAADDEALRRMAEERVAARRARMAARVA